MCNPNKIHKECTDLLDDLLKCFEYSKIDLKKSNAMIHRNLAIGVVGKQADKTDFRHWSAQYKERMQTV